MTPRQLKSWLTQQLYLAEPISTPSTIADARQTALTATRELGLLGLGDGHVYLTATKIKTPQECAAVLIDCLAMLRESEIAIEPELLTLDEAASYLGYQVSGLRKVVNRKEITYFQNGNGPIKFKQEWLDQFIEKNTSTGPQNSAARIRRPKVEPRFGFDPALYRRNR